MEKTTLDDLVSQYNALEKDTTSVVLSTTKWYKKYILYVALFLWTFVFVLIARPSTMYETDPETNKRKLRFGKTIITFIVIYLTLVGTVLGVTYWQKWYP
jgi:hypothetical protein